MAKIIHQDEVNEFLRNNGHKYGVEFARAVAVTFNTWPEVEGLDFPVTGEQYAFAANHSLGGLDGILLALCLGDHFGHISIPVNDILMNLENMNNLFIPLNLHGRTPRDSFRRLDEVYSSPSQVLMFPSGQVSRKRKGIIKDGTWHKTFLTKAIQHGRPVVPVFVGGRNSPLFYGVHRIRTLLGISANLEMFLLSHELFLKKNMRLPIVFGRPVPPGFFDKTRSTQDWANALRDYVYLLGKGEKRPFTHSDIQRQLR